MAAKVFMLGWEFPPYISGGLGTACYGLTKAMSRMGTEITFVLPRASGADSGGHVRLQSAEGEIKIAKGCELRNVHFKTIASSLRPYAACGTAEGCASETLSKCCGYWQNAQDEQANHYGGNIYEQVQWYAQKAAEMAIVEDFDVIHAHDWMTYPAAEAVAAVSGKPIVAHIHSTEFDRSGENVNQVVYDIERRGMLRADQVVAVSGYTKNRVYQRYGVPSEKVEVVYNGVENDTSGNLQPRLAKTEKIVLFLGRMTMQKGPEYFIAAAKKVLEKFRNVTFVMAGDGDMTHRMIEYAASLGIGHKVLFTRLLRGADVDRAFRMADLFVMPSVSEPFGIAPLEALRNQTPVLISKQSGIAEVLRNALTVDFWDIDQMANKMAAVLKYSPLRDTLRENGHAEL